MQSMVNSKSLFMRFLLTKEIILRADAPRLAELAEFAISIRAWEPLAQIASRLSMIPGIDKDIALTYSALALNRTPGCRVQGEQLLRGIAESSHPSLRARCNLALGSNFLAEDKDKSLALYQKAAELDEKSPLNIFHTAIMSIAAQDQEGYHHRTLDALNSISRLARYIGSIHRPYYFEYLNSVAVVLNDLGDYEGAQKTLAPAVASPCAIAYREWTETDKDIERNLNHKPLVQVLDFPSVARRKQVKRIERVIYGARRISAEQLKAYADAGDAALAR